MRFLLIAVIAACKSDPSPPAPTAPAPSNSALDTTTLPGAPTPATIAGWWVVEPSFLSPNDEPGHRGGHAWWFGPDAMKLVFGDADDRRAITATKADGDALRVEIDGADLWIRRRRAGISIEVEGQGQSHRIPLRRATPGEIGRLEALEKKKQRMVERACEKAYQCCTAAVAKKVAKDDDCRPLLGPPDLARCIQAITIFKNKAATGNVTIAECLPDK